MRQVNLDEYPGNDYSNTQVGMRSKTIRDQSDTFAKLLFMGTRNHIASLPVQVLRRRKRGKKRLEEIIGIIRPRGARRLMPVRGGNLSYRWIWSK